MTWPGRASAIAGDANATAHASRSCAFSRVAATSNAPSSRTAIVRRLPSAATTASAGFSLVLVLDAATSWLPSPGFQSTHVVIPNPPPPQRTFEISLAATPRYGSEYFGKSRAWSASIWYSVRYPPASATASFGPFSVLYRAGAHRVSNIARVSSGAAAGTSAHPSVQRSC